MHAIDRMMPMLRFFRHGDGNFALFNGMGTTRSDILSTILAYDDARGTPVANAAHSGYQRLEAGGTVVIMDTGTPPPMPVSQEAHAGCLSFELSAKLNRIVVNCGLPASGRDSWRQVARATSAHSTATFNDVSSCRFIESGPIRRMLQGAPIIGGPRNVEVAREEGEGGALVLRTSHDGYADNFGVIHRRAIMLSADGSRLDGEDVFSPERPGDFRRTRPVRAALPPASVGEGQPAAGFPRRDADAAQQGGVDLQRLRGPHRARGKRLPRRQ